MNIYPDAYFDKVEDISIEFLKKNKIKELLDKKDMPNYSVEVHSLKSDAKYFGMDKLASISLDHELKSKDGNYEYVSKNFKTLEKEVKRIIQVVSKYLD